jgi:DNA polymerase-3 subunit delta
MVSTAQKVFKSLEAGDWKPLCLVVGAEPFQSNEIFNQFKKRFVREDVGQALNYELWDGEGLNGGQLLNSLDMLPGLFSSEEEIRLIVCQRFDRVAPGQLEILQSYFNQPLSSTVFLMMAEKVDKRKSWYKAVEAQGDIVEIREPYDREWPKWAGYFEKRHSKKIEPAAWEMLVSGSGRCLSFLATDIEKLVCYVGDKSTIQLSDVQAMGASSSGEDIFSFVEDLAMKRKGAALKRYDLLMRSGESDIKLLSIVVRQFRMIEQALRLSKQGVNDPKTVAAQIGSHPFFVSKIFEQMKKHSQEEVGRVLDLLAQCDYQIKTGDGNLFERLLIPYFSIK